MPYGEQPDTSTTCTDGSCGDCNTCPDCKNLDCLCTC